MNFLEMVGLSFIVVVIGCTFYFTVVLLMEEITEITKAVSKYKKEQKRKKNLTANCQCKDCFHREKCDWKDSVTDYDFCSKATRSADKQDW